MAQPIASEALVGFPRELAGAQPAAAELSPAFRDATPAAYTPKHLAEKILSRRSAVEGERKLVTVMFADVSGFTAISERLDPEEIHAIMNRAFEVILGAVHHYEGTINQFLGDGVMALFGAPIAHEDHPHRAVRAALDIQDGLSPLKKEVRQTHGMKFRVRMGINTGLVFAGAIGKDLRQDYTAVGDTTNLTARLMGLAEPGQIVVSAHTHQLTKGFFVFEDLGEFAVKGKAERVRAYAVASEIKGRTRLEVSRERGLTPLVGRESELHRLTAAYDRAAGVQGAIVLVTGEPGIGKSRVLYEFLHGLEGKDILELEATCVTHGRSMPYHPIVELLRRYLALTDGVAADEISRRVAERLRFLGIEEEEPAILLAHFLGASAPEAFLTRLAGAQLKERTFGVLRAVLLRASEAQPVVVVVENVHWADPSSEEFLRHLAEGLPGHRLLLLLSSRPGFEAPWLAPPLADTITVEGLDAAGVRYMILTLLAVDGVSKELLKVLMEKGEGNPLYVEEILRQLQDTSGIVIEDAEARLRGADVRVPATIHDIIAARIDRLAEPVKHALQVAAVVGRQFAVPLLSRVLKTNGELGGHLDDLQENDFIFLSAREPEPVYSFKHALTQEVAYAGLLERRRRVYHADVGVGLEELHAGRTDEVVELLAYHFGRSKEDEKAVDYAILAAEKAQRRWANTEALAQFEAALKRLEPMPDTTPNRLRRIDGVVKQAEIKFALGRHAEHVQALEAIRELVETAADTPRRAAWYYWTGFLHSLIGSHPDVAIAYCRDAAAIADATGLEEIKGFAESCLSHVLVVAGDMRGALESGERALAMFLARGNVWWACRTLWALSPAANALGDWQRSLDYCRRGLEYGREMNDRRVQVVAWLRMGSTHAQRGDGAAAVRCCEEALGLSPAAFDAAMIKAVHGYALVKAGQAAEGTAELGEAVAWFGRSQLPYTRSLVALLLADGQLRAGVRSEARRIAEEVLADSRTNGHGYLEGIAGRILVECLALDDPAGALVHLEAALGRLQQIGARNEVAKILVARARVARAARDRAAARRDLEAALATFQALGTVDGPDRVRVLLQLLDAREGPRLVVITREQRALYESLANEFAEQEDVRVVLDRRRRERRQGGAVQHSDRRQGDRRMRLRIDADLGESGYAIVPGLSL